MGMFSQLMANESNERIAKQNLDFQRENYEYEKALQNQIFNREDTSYQRTVSDMQAAGLSPLSMNGTNGAGEAISMQAPQNSYHSESLQALESVGQIFNLINQANTIKNNSTLANAQSNLLNAQAENQSVKNLYESDLLDLTRTGMTHDNFRKNLENIFSQHDLMFNQAFGLSNNMPESLKTSLMMSGKKGLNFDLNSFFKYYGTDTFKRMGNSTWVFSDFDKKDLLSNDMKTALIENKLWSLGAGLLTKVLGDLF